MTTFPRGIYGILFHVYFFFFFFNPIQPFLLPRISTQREKSGLISRTFVQFNLNSNIELFFFFFFIPYSAPSQIIDSYTKKKKKTERFSFLAATHFPRGTKSRFRILRSFANAPTPIDFYVALRKPTLASELSPYSLREENPFPIFDGVEILISISLSIMDLRRDHRTSSIKTPSSRVR